MTNHEIETIKVVIMNLSFYRDHGLSIMLNLRGGRQEPVVQAVSALCMDAGDLAAASIEVLERLVGAK